MKNLPPVKREPGPSLASSSKTYSVSSRDDDKRNLMHEMVDPSITSSDDVLPFMDLVRSLLIQYPQIRQYEMQKKIINNLYDGLMNSRTS